MASFAENGRDVLLSQADSYVRYAFAAQQEFFELGMNLLTRQVDTGLRIVGARDFGEAFVACSDLLKANADDFSSAATRLFDRASDAGRAVVEDTAQSVGEVAAAATEAVQKVDEVVEKSEQVVRASSAEPAAQSSRERRSNRIGPGGGTKRAR
jgi:methyl-accepting chemotaxis protein